MEDADGVDDTRGILLFEHRQLVPSKRRVHKERILGRPLGARMLGEDKPIAEPPNRLYMVEGSIKGFQTATQSVHRLRKCTVVGEPRSPKRLHDLIPRYRAPRLPRKGDE